MTRPHVFMTRFNLPANKVESSIYSEQWLLERMELFRRFTLPSVMDQLEEERYWLIYLNPESPAWLRESMDSLRDRSVAFPVYLEGALTPQRVRDHICQATGRSSGVVSTSNLDNDDGLAMNYLRRLRDVPFGAERRVVYFANGLIYCQGALFAHRDPANTFAAVMDDLASPDFLTCWSEWHNRLAHLMPEQQYAGDPAWLQVIHGRNVSNRVRGRRTRPGHYVQLFHGLLDDVADPSWSELVVNNAIQRPVRLLRDGLRGPGAKLTRRLVGPDRFDELKHRLSRT